MKRHPRESLASAGDKEDTCEIKVMRKGKGDYECIKCYNTFDRRYNGVRHFDRFHVMIDSKTCCNETFCTKGDYYDHREKMHNDIKRYGRQWKNKLLKRHLDEKGEEAAGSSNQQHDIFLQNQLTNNANILCHSDTFDIQRNITTLRKRPRKGSHPRKCDIYATNPDESSAVLKDINSSVNNTRNNASQNIQKRSTILHNIAEADKENVRIYTYKFTSITELQKTLTSGFSINF